MDRLKMGASRAKPSRGATYETDYRMERNDYIAAFLEALEQPLPKKPLIPPQGGCPNER